MIVVTLTDCPIGLRGDLTKWLMEIQSGVFVGNVSARVREKLWKRIKGANKSGRAVMVYSTNNEQRLDFFVSGNTWEPIDFDGIKLMLRPSPSRLKKNSNLKQGFSNAAQNLTATRVAAKRRFPRSYVVVDLETTGLDPDKDEILQIAALKVDEGKICGNYAELVKVNRHVPVRITEINGITDEMVADHGIPLSLAFANFLEFTDKRHIVSHNSNFDYAFLKKASLKCGLPLFGNACIDTLAMAKRAVKGVNNYKLFTLANHFGIAFTEPHRAENDCAITQLLYEKLINLLEPK